MTDREFDSYLEDIMDTPPPEELSGEFTPWRAAMNRILWGTVWTTLTFRFWNLDVILPAVGWIMLLLGYRALRRENIWFRLGYGISCFRLCFWLLNFALNATIFAGEPALAPWRTAAGYSMILPGFLILLALRNGIRSVQKKSGLPPHGGNGMLVWFVLIVILALLQISGLTAWGLMIAYVCILRNLFALSKELDEAGYAVTPAPVRFSDSSLKRVYVGSMALALVIGFAFFGKYPMDWKPVPASEDPEVSAVRQELLELGFPAHILDDLTREDILACRGALRVVTEVNDHPVNNGREVREQDGDSTFITTVYDQKELRLTGIAVELPGEPERWKLIHHFQWTIDPGFPGTEVIQLWPADRHSEGWASWGSLTGRVLYTKEQQTYSSPYHSLEALTYDSQSFLWGPQTNTDIFAAFSMPGSGGNHRGYVSYTISELEDGHSISSWLNYTHQTLRLQYPVITAREKHLTQGFGDTIHFKTIQDAIQFYPGMLDAPAE